MPRPVSRVDFCAGFCDFALNVVSSLVRVCCLWLLFPPVGRSHMSCPLSSLTCVISKSQLSKLSFTSTEIQRLTRLYILRVQRRASRSSKQSSPNVPPCPLYRPHPLKVRLQVPLWLLHPQRPRIRPPRPRLLASDSHPSSSCSFTPLGLLCHHPPIFPIFSVRISTPRCPLWALVPFKP
jgi:hypothetical protein